MAKKNSSKTATEKAIQASEPRVMVYKDWKGVNYVDAPLTWEPMETDRYAHRQLNLPHNYLMVQNNLNTTETLSLETRMDNKTIGMVPDGYQFTGISCVFHRWIFCVIRYKLSSNWYERIVYRDMRVAGYTNWGDLSTYTWNNMQKFTWVEINDIKNMTQFDWNTIKIAHSDSVTGSDLSTGYDPVKWEISEIGCYEDNLVVTAANSVTKVGAVFLAKLNYDADLDTIDIKGVNWFSITNSHTTEVANVATSNPTVSDPSRTPTLTATGMSSGATASNGTVNEDTGAIINAHSVRIEVCYAYTTRFGSTLADTATPATIFTEYSPTLWSSARFITIAMSNDANVKVGSGITGIDFYGRDTENTDWVFIGHIDLEPTSVTSTSWSYKWFGNMTDISQWVNSQLTVPNKNDTCGPNVRHFSVHDSKLYYWGDPKYPYRLYIGGNPGNEFSVARGLGGAYVDIEPGSGYDVKGTAKWKTVSGANIVTIMCGNGNTNKVKRFNLVETNITITNEISYKGYMYEEVSNVVGCNSRWGFGVFADGLYSFSRYGLMLTTMAMEYNSQMKNQSVSDVISPLFTERMGERLRDARIVYINDIIYLALSEEQGHPTEPTSLDNVILCYDLKNQAWFTYTCTENNSRGITWNEAYASKWDDFNETIWFHFGDGPGPIYHIIPIDSDQCPEGLGVITDKRVYLYPTTGIQESSTPFFDVLLETGELMPKEPQNATAYIQQLEFRFNYFIGDPEEPCKILVEGTDYYGRSFAIEKELNIDGGRGNHGKSQYTEMRSYVEWIRVDKLVESYRIRIKGRARFSLNHIAVKFYLQPDVIGTQWGFDAHDHYQDAHGTEGQIHHYINSYNNLRRALVS